MCCKFYAICTLNNQTNSFPASGDFLSSADNRCKQFGSRSGPMFWHSDGFPERFFEKVNLKKKTQMTKNEKLPTMQRVNLFVLKGIGSIDWLLHQKQLLWLSTCFSAGLATSEKGSTIKGKNLLPSRANFFTFRVYGKCPKISNTYVSDKMAYANSADPDQTAPKEQSDQGLHCVPFH